jgi:hypothetical protein
MKFVLPIFNHLLAQMVLKRQQCNYLDDSKTGNAMYDACWPER